MSLQECSIIHHRDMLNNIELKNKPTVSESQLDSITRNHKSENFIMALNKIGSCIENANAYYDKAIDYLEESKDTTAYNLVKRNILPKILKENMDDLKECIDCSDISKDVKEKLNSDVSKIETYDRIVNNHNRILNRYNFEKTLSSKCNDINNTIEDLCELIDTYEMTESAKCNIALEEISYSMYSSRSEVLTESQQYDIIRHFMSNKFIMTDKEYERFENVIENNIFISEDTRESLSSIMEAHKSYNYKNKVSKLADKCDDPENKKFVMQVLKVKTEKQASQYMNVAVNKISKLSMTDNDRKNIIRAMWMIPLIGNVSVAFVKYEYNILKNKQNAIDKIEDQEFVELMNDIYDDIDESNIDDEYYDSDQEVLMTIADDIDSFVSAVDDIFSDSFEEASIQQQLLESEELADSKDIKELIKNFNMDQKKDIGRFKNMLAKIYRKSPQNIIDNTPNLLSSIRVLFIIGTGVAIPTVGPAIALVLAFVDHMISRRINEKQADKLLAALDAEKEKTEKKLAKCKGGSKEKDLEKYLNCLKKCTDKVEDYRGDLTEDDDPRNSGGSDDLLDDDDVDFDFEEAVNIITYNQCLTEVLECEGFTDMFMDHISELNGPELSTLLGVAHKCPNLFDYNRIHEYMKDKINTPETMYKFNSIFTDYVNSDFNTDVYTEESALEDLAFEYYVMKECQQAISEGFSDTSKLLLQNIKKFGKEANTKYKSFWQTIDINAHGMMTQIERSMTSNRREGIIKGSIIPSFSKCLKAAIMGGAAIAVNPILGLIGCLGAFAVSKKLNDRERQLIYDEIDTELKVVEKQISIAEADGDMNQYRALLKYQKKLEREKQRIRYKLKVYTRDIPNND